MKPAGRAADIPAVPCRRVGDGAQHHFFGYYDKSNWDASGRHLLAQRTAMMTADLAPDSEATIGYFDLEDGDRFRVVGRTTAWNWQMGSQLQWLGNARSDVRRLIYNVRLEAAVRPAGVTDSRPWPAFGARIHDLASGADRDLPLPVHVVAPSGGYALCVDYRRLQVTHPTIGYRERDEPFALDRAPADDGIHRMELDTGRWRLLVSYAQLAAFDHRASMDAALHWVSHIEINPSSSRILFLHRWSERVDDETCFLHRLITMNPDGSDMRLLECSDHPLPQLAVDFDPQAVGTFDYEKSEWQISHPLWRDDRSIIVWGPHEGCIRYHLYEDRPQGAVRVVGAGVLVENGHMSFSPTDPRWLLSDTYPDPLTHERVLFLYDMESGRRHDLGSFFASPALGKVNRCDLHPRWRGDGRQVCIDSVHEGARQMYLLDVTRIVTG